MTQTCNVCGYTGTFRESHDCSAVMQERIAILTARAERAELAMRNAEAGVLALTETKRDFIKALEAEKAAREKAEAEVVRLRDFVSELADESCIYGDNCPPFVNTRHGTCLPCQARAALGE